MAGQHGSGRQRSASTVVPCDFQSFASFDSLPVSGGHNSNAIRDFNHINHTRHGLGGCAVNAYNFTADDGALLQAGVNHAGQFDVDTEFSSAVDFGRNVGTGNALTNHLEVFGSFDGGFFRNGLLGGSFSHLTVGGFLAAGANQGAVNRFDCTGGNAPLSSSSANQHFADLSASDTQFFVAFTNGCGTTSDHGAQQSVDVYGVRCTSSHVDFGDVDVQLFSDQHRHGGVNTLAHFGTCRDKSDGVVVSNVHPCIGGVQCASGHGFSDCARQHHAQD